MLIYLFDLLVLCKWKQYGRQ